VARRHQLRGQRPQAFFDRAGAREAFDAEGAAQHPLDVAVEDRRLGAEANGGDGVGRGAADAGQLRDRFGAARKPAAVLAHHGLRAGVQVARAGVVAEPAPQRHDFFRGRGGEAGEVRKACEEAPVVGNHRRHLRLLQHDLGEPDAVGIACAALLLPGQVVPAGLLLPGDDAMGEVAGARG